MSVEEAKILINWSNRVLEYIFRVSLWFSWLFFELLISLLRLANPINKAPRPVHTYSHGDIGICKITAPAIALSTKPMLMINISINIIFLKYNE